MLAKWTEILPLFIIRLLAKKYCEQVEYQYLPNISRDFAIARPDVLIKINKGNNAIHKS